MKKEEEQKRRKGRKEKEEERRRRRFENKGQKKNKYEKGNIHVLSKIKTNGDVGCLATY